MKITKTQLTKMIREAVREQMENDGTLEEDWRDPVQGYGDTDEEKFIEKAKELVGLYGDSDTQNKDALRLLEKAVAYLRRVVR